MADPKPARASPLCIRLSTRERERLQTAATKAGRTLAGEIKWRCFKKCKEQEAGNARLEQLNPELERTALRLARLRREKLDLIEARATKEPEGAAESKA